MKKPVEGELRRIRSKLLWNRFCCIQPSRYFLLAFKAHSHFLTFYCNNLEKFRNDDKSWRVPRSSQSTIAAKRFKQLNYFCQREKIHGIKDLLSELSSLRSRNLRRWKSSDSGKNVKRCRSLEWKFLIFFQMLLQTKGCWQNFRFAEKKEILCLTNCK